jgi:hypothetical protein
MDTGWVQSTKTVKVGESFLRRGQCIVVEILKLNTMIHKGSLSRSIYCSIHLCTLCALHNLRD